MNDDMRRLLNERFPRGAISTRKQGGKELSYAEGHYVIRKLNEIFGNARWSYRCTTREAFREQLDDGDKGKRWHVSYSSSCELRAGDAVIVDVGHGHGIDRDCGLAIESAEKEAATDSLKRCAKSLGDALGLALYSKGQEHVADEEEPATVDSGAWYAVAAQFQAATGREAYKAARAAMADVWGSVPAAGRDVMTKAQNEAAERLKKEAK